MTRNDNAAPDIPPEGLEDEGLGDEISRTLGEIAPWAVSIFAHVLLVLLALFLVWTTVLQEEEEPWSGQANIFTQSPISPVNDPAVDPSEDEPAPATAPMLPQDPTPTPLLPDTIGPNGLNQLHLPNLPQGPTTPSDNDRDGVPNSGILGDIGVQTVFVIDASGSLIDTFPMVVNELKRLLGQLARAEQQRQADPGRQNRKPFAYAVVFFRDGEVMVQDRRGLRVADRDAVNRSQQWLDTVSPGGSTSPLPAIELALSYHPDTIVLLSDNITGHGIHELSTDTLIEQVLDARDGRETAINTIQFLYPDPQEAYGGTGTLERLAEETGGEHRFVSDRELNLR